ncbi:MAG: signal peptide peptidase SppA [Bryobacteraceae bacterium]
MKKFLLGLLCGFLLAGLGCIILFFALVRLGESRPSIPSEGALVLRLEGDLPELAPMELPLPVFQAQTPPSLAEVWSMLRKAEKDPRVKAIFLEPRGVGVGWARLQEIRASLLNFRRSGKPVYAFLRNPGTREYYLATAADRIFFTQEDILDLKGLRAEMHFYRRTLDKIGVEFEVEHAGKYKDAADGYVRTGPSPETREVMNSVLDTVFQNLLDVVGTSRKMKEEQVRALIDQGPFLAKQALAKGLVDGLAFEDEAYDKLAAQVKIPKLARIGMRDYRQAPVAGFGEGKTKVALLIGEGTITRGGESDPFGDDEGIRSGSFIQTLRQVAEDSSISGVILRVNSPGGDAIASDEILHEVRKLAKAKPMVISMSDMAASGGYYISMTGDPVIAYPLTYTGSIGVIFGKPNARQLYSKLGIDIEVMKRGQNADFDLLSQPMSAAARTRLKEGIDNTYRAFLDRVSEGRKRKTSEIEPLAEGRVWMGSQAKANGLVDELGGLDKALDLVKKKANVPDGERVQILLYPKRKSLFEQLFNSMPEASSEARARREVRARIREWASTLGIDPGRLALWSQGGVFRLAPFELRIR